MCFCHSFAICLVCSQFYAGSHLFQSQVRTVVRAGGWGAGQSFCVLPARTAHPLNCSAQNSLLTHRVDGDGHRVMAKLIRRV